MEFTRKIIDGNGMGYLSLTKDISAFLEVKPGDEVVIKDYEGKHGKYIAVWKKKAGVKPPQ